MMNDLDFQKMADNSSYEGKQRKLEINWREKDLVHYKNPGGHLNNIPVHFTKEKQTYEDYIKEINQ